VQTSKQAEIQQLRKSYDRVLVDTNLTSKSTIRQLRNDLSSMEKELTSFKDYLRKTIDVVNHKVSQANSCYFAKVAELNRDKERLMSEVG